MLKTRKIHTKNRQLGKAEKPLNNNARKKKQFPEPIHTYVRETRTKSRHLTRCFSERVNALTCLAPPTPGLVWSSLVENFPFCRRHQ